MLPLVLGLLSVSSAFAALVYMKYVGREGGGARAPSEAERDPPSTDEMKQHILWRSFYVNADDPRGWVPKTWGGGYTPNFRSRERVLVFIGLLGAATASALGLVAWALCP